MNRKLHLKPRYYRWHVDPGVEWIEPNTAYAHLDWTIPLSRAALVLVDVWDAHYLKDTAARAEEIIQTTLRPLLHTCRASGLEVIHAPSPPQAEVHANWVGAGRDKKPAEEARETAPAPGARDWPPADFRSKSGEYKPYARPTEVRQGEIDDMRARRIIHPVAEPLADEVVISTGQELHEYCAGQGILFLIFAGFNTNACILLRDYGTIEMSKRGYEILILRDCTTGMESFETCDALGQTTGAIQFLEMFGKGSITSEELISGLAS